MDRTRRGFLSAAAALAAARNLAAFGKDGSSPITRADLDNMLGKVRGNLTCVKTPEGQEGPFYSALSPRRRNLTEGRTKGVPLKLGITVANANGSPATCGPLADAVVDIWHADADGMYSNVTGDVQMEDTRGKTFMRGHLITDANGYVEFDTVVPCWEAVSSQFGPLARTTHIHAKIFHENTIVTTQLYLPDDFLDQLYASVDPYQRHMQLRVPGVEKPIDRVCNAADAGFLNDQSTPMPVERYDKGVIARATVGIATLERGLPSLYR